MSDARWQEIVAHRDRLVRIARRRCPSREDAEDVVSEAMLRCAAFGRLDDERLGQFLTAVTLRLCADLYRDVDRTTKIVRTLAPQSRSVDGPETAACTAVDAELVREALGALPEKQRDVLVDRASGLSVSQISQRHSLTYKAVESALSRARFTMRNALSGALGSVTSAGALLRRRPARAAALALPVATLALTSSVIRLPWSPDVGPGTRALPPAVRPAAASPRTARAAVETGALPASVRIAAPRADVTAGRAPAKVRPVARPRPYKPPVVDQQFLDTRTKVTDNRREEPPEDYLARCVKNGIWLKVVIKSDEVGSKQGCHDDPKSPASPGAVIP